MTIIEPYKRIIRPFFGKSSFEYSNGVNSSLGDSHILDSRYASDRISLIRAYHILEKDLVSLFDFIEPSDGNSKVFSHRIYELFLRASTEFEANCKGILNSNNYQSKNDFNICDYYKLNSWCKLSEYEIKLSIWQGNSFNSLGLQWNLWVILVVF
mgnify:CR=1 FL=1